MNANDLVGPAVIAAIVSALVTSIGIVISNRTATRIHSEKLKFDEALAEKKFRFDTDLADQKFLYERQLHDLRRRLEFGEDLLAGFYKFKDVIAAVRSPAARGEEGASRPQAIKESPAVAKNRNTYFVPLERLNSNRDFISEFFSKRHRARAMFRGSEIDRGFMLLGEALAAVRVSAGILINAVGDERRDPAFWEKREADIWDGFGNDADIVASKINEALGIAEKVLGPALEDASRLTSKACP